MKNIIYAKFIDGSVSVSTGKGLNAECMNDFVIFSPYKSHQNAKCQSNAT